MNARYRKNLEYGQNFLNHDPTNWGNDVKINVRENGNTKSSINFSESVENQAHKARNNATFKSSVNFSDAQVD